MYKWRKKVVDGSKFACTETSITSTVLNQLLVLPHWNTKQTKFFMLLTSSAVQDQTSIHRHQTPPRYCHATHSSCCTVQPPGFGIAQTSAKRDVIHNTGST